VQRRSEAKHVGLVQPRIPFAANHSAQCNAKSLLHSSGGGARSHCVLARQELARFRRHAPRDPRRVLAPGKLAACSLFRPPGSRKPARRTLTRSDSKCNSKRLLGEPPGSRLPSGQHCPYEPKLDGFRGLLWHRSMGQAQLLSRNTRDLDQWFSELMRAARRFPPDPRRRRDRDLRRWRASNRPS
jgi:hypothetical protein